MQVSNVFVYFFVDIDCINVFYYFLTNIMRGIRILFLLAILFLVSGCTMKDMQIRWWVLQDQAKEQRNNVKQEAKGTLDDMQQEVRNVKQQAKSLGTTSSWTVSSCLADEPIVMYGSLETCPLTQGQQKELWPVMEVIKFVDCEEQYQVCKDAWVDQMPLILHTQNDKKTQGEVYSLAELEEYFCE